MRNNRTTLRILSVLLVCFLFIGNIADAQTVTELLEARNKAEDLVAKKKAEHDVYTDRLNEMIGNFVTLHANLVSIKISVTPATSPGDLIGEFTKVVEALTKSNLLTSAMRTMLANIETQRGTCNTIWADVVLAQSAYEDAVDAYNAVVSPEEQVTPVKVPPPSVVSDLYLCPGPCSTPFTTQVLARTSHQVFCQVPHKFSKAHSYYSCPPDYSKKCDKTYDHKVTCRGGCGTYFTTKSGSNIPEDGSHYKGVCEGFDIPESYIKTFGSSSKMVDCPGRFYNCNGQTSATDCNFASAHLKDAYPKKLACGHAAGTLGDHFRVGFSCGHEDYYCYRLDHDGKGCTGYVHPDDRVSPGQKSGETLGACGHLYKPTPATIRVHRQSRCPSGPNGEVCSSGSYWVCQSHTHSYVTTDTDTDTDPPKPDPKLTRQACGHVYDPSSSSAYTHREVSCPKENGKSCTSGTSYACTSHTHTYSTDPPKPDPKLTRQACGHVYDPSSSSAYMHRSVLCPDKNGVSCTSGSSYVCQTHTHSYPAAVRCANNNRGVGKCSSGRVVSGSDAYEHLRKCAAGHSYWSCNATAVSAHSWHKATTTPTPTTTQPTTPTPTPSYHACGIHQTSVSGDHSLQASCSRDSRCIAQSFYYCQHSSHTYRTAPPPPPPPPKKPVVCPAHSWTNCGGTSSHATTCGADHTYYTCNPSAVTAHKGHQKNTPVVCPAHSWTGCGGTSSHATTCKAGHPYYSCNPSAVTAHKWHVKAGVKCPAHAWTNCNGATSHAKTCGRGHKYYTCNASAVTAHKWH